MHKWMKPWVIADDDRAYLEAQYALLDKALADCKRIRKRINAREHKVWAEGGGRERYLADEQARHNQESRTP